MYLGRLRKNATKEQSDAAVVVKENKQLSGYVGVTGIRIKDDGTITKMTI